MEREVSLTKPFLDKPESYKRTFQDLVDEDSMSDSDDEDTFFQQPRPLERWSTLVPSVEGTNNIKNTLSRLNSVAVDSPTKLAGVKLKPRDAPI